jgi:hypothetical protein
MIARSSVLVLTPITYNMCLLSHVTQVLEPLQVFKDSADATKYPPIKAGDQVNAELQAIALGVGYTLNKQ